MKTLIKTITTELRHQSLCSAIGMCGKKIWLAFILLTSFHAHAQQDPSYSMFMYTGTTINPAVAGSAGSLTATALYRQQWMSIKGAPETQVLNLDVPVFSDKVGLGLSIINDKIGVTQNLNMNAQYAYRIKFEKGVLSMGLQGGVNNYKADYTAVVTNPQNTIDNSFSESTNRMIFNFGSGVYYYSEKFYAGFSVPHIINQALDGLNNSNGAQSRQYRHYYFTAGYAFTLSENFIIKPSTLVKLADGAPLQVDINSNFWYQEKYCVGFSYRTNDSVTGLVQLRIASQFTVGYAYDFIISSMSRYTTGNNEVMLRYLLPGKSKTAFTLRKL